MKSIIIVNLIVVISGASPSFLQDDGEPSTTAETQAEIAAEFSDATVVVVPAPSDKLADPKSENEPPEWYKEGVGGFPSKDGEQSFLVYSIPCPSAEESQLELKEKLVSEVMAHIDEHILKHVAASDIPGLTKSYVEKNILPTHSDRIYSKSIQKAGGPMYTGVRQVTIDKREVDRITAWESQFIVSKRSKEVGLFGGIGLAGMTVLSGLIGLLARREKAKLKG
jgi:hypothetical protein